MTSWAIPIAAATRRAPSSSPAATDGETAVTASAWSPRARAASAATTDESTPPENATTAEPSTRNRPSSLVKGSDPLCTVIGRGQGSCPDRLGGCVDDAGGALAVGVLGGEVDDAPVEAADFDPDRLAGDLDRPGFALELDPVEVRDAHAERARLAEERGGDGALALRAREGGHHKARAAVLHRHGGRPHVDRAGVEGGGRGVRRELGEH